MAAVVEIKNLALAYPESQGNGTRTILQRVDLTIERGEFVAVVGTSGVGKSTLLRVVAGLAQPSHGSVRLNTQSRPDSRATALVFQESRLLPWRRVLQNVLFGLEGLELTKAERMERAREVLRLVRLEDLADRWPAQLSGGQRQRVGIARALATNPDLLLMDEPFGSLDAITRRHLQDELLDIWGETGLSVLFVTHDIDEAVYLADRVVLLAGTPATVARTTLVREPRPRQRELAGYQRTVAAIKAGLTEVFSHGEGI